MWFRRNTKHKTRPKLLTALLSMLLVVCMSIPIIQQNTLTVYADYDGTEGDGTGYTRGNIGASQSNVCILLYIADGATGAPVTGSVIVGQKYFGDMPQKLTSKSVNGGQVDLSAQGLVVLTDPSVPLPLTSTDGNWNPNGEAVKAHLLKTTPSGRKYYEAYLEMAFASQADILAQIKSNPSAYNIVVHALCKLHIDGSTNKLYTTDGAAQDYESMIGGQHTFVHGGMYNCMITEKAHWGVNPPSNASGVHPVNLAELAVTGWGIHVLDLDPTDGQTTCDETQGGTPSRPADESTGIYKIVKTYRTVDEQTGEVISDDGSFEKDDCSAQITIEDESLYRLKAWKTSSTHQCTVAADGWEHNVPPAIKRQGTTPTTITMGVGEDTVYLLLEREEPGDEPTVAEGHFIISESTISRKIKLSIPDRNVGYTNIKDLTSTWHANYHYTSCHTSHKCSGCEEHTNDDGSKYYTCPGHSCSGWKWKDQDTIFSLKNTLKSDYPDVLATKGNIQAVTKTGEDESDQWYRPYKRTNTGVDDKEYKDWDYACVIMRGKDKLTLAQWKNNNLGYSAANTYLKDLSSSGFAVGDKATSHRKLADYGDEFSISLAKLSNGNTDYQTTYYPTVNAPKAGTKCADDTETYSLKSTLDADVKVKVETYAGKKAGTTALNTVCNTSPSVQPTFEGSLSGHSISQYTKRRGIEVQSANITFRPYVQMNYDTYDYSHEKYSSSTDAHETAYVLGEYDRSMSINDYAEVSWKEHSGGPNLTLSSLQWSTHASVADYVGGTLGANPSDWQALPGGATLALDIKKTDRQTVMATTYQCVVEGTGKEQIDKTVGTYGGPSIASATSAHEAYVQSVIQGLDKLNVEQWAVNKVDISKDVWDISGSSAVHPNRNLDMIGRGSQKASNESKYYFWDDGEQPEAPASEGDLDVEEVGTYTETYTFFTNTYGEIRYIVGNVNGNKTDERAGIDITGGLDPISNQINERTHVVDKLRDAVEQKQGDDPTGRSKTGEQWYSEAFDGVTVYVSSTELTVGYIEPPTRQSVLDPKLTQEQKSQSDMFNKTKYNQSQYRTKPFSEAYGDDDQVGIFKGQAVFMQDMKMLFWSKGFLIPNATVDDLH